MFYTEYPKCDMLTADAPENNLVFGPKALSLSLVDRKVKIKVT